MPMMEHEDGADTLSVRCRAQSGATAVLPVLDISPGGCMVPCRDWLAMAGERVLAKVGGLGVLPGKVVWVEEGLAGIGFDEVLHSAVYDQLRARLEGTYVDLAGDALRAEQEAAAKRRQSRRSIA